MIPMTDVAVAEVTEEPEGPEVTRPGILSHPLDLYLGLPRESQTWLIKPLIPAGGTVLIYGDPKVGKSNIAIQLCAALNGAATDWFEFPVLEAGNVLYLQLDTPRPLWMERFDDLRAAGYPLGTPNMADRESFGCFPFDIMNPVHFHKLRAEVDAIRPLAVVIDTIRESHQLEENSSTEMQKVIARLSAAVRPAALILIAHPKKPTLGPDGIIHRDITNDMRGSGYMAGRMDTIIRLSRKSLHFVGRAVEEGQVKLRRDSKTFLMVVDADEDKALPHIKAVLADPSLSAMKDRARELASRVGRSEEAARHLIRRYLDRPGTFGHSGQKMATLAEGVANPEVLAIQADTP